MIEDIDQDVNISWNKIASELKKSLDKDTFQNWIKPINFETQLDNSLTLSVPTRFLRDWIIKNYASVIKRAYLDQGVTVDKLSIIVKENNNRIIPGTEVVYQDNEDDEDTYYDDISAPLDPQFTFDNFIEIENVDTDQIIPKQFLKLVQKSGFGKFLFFNWRYDENENIKSDFILNDSKRASAILCFPAEVSY